MSRPVVSSVAEELYAALGPWAEQDTQDERWDLLIFCEAVTLGLVKLEALIRDTDLGPGWSQALSIENAPTEWLPWLAQFVGTRVPEGVSETEQRNIIRDASGLKRGTTTALVAAVKAQLTGSQYVLVNERVGGNAWQLGVRTLGDETPDPDLVLRAILSQKPAGIVVDYDTITGHDYGDLRVGYDYYEDVNEAFDDYEALQENNPS